VWVAGELDEPGFNDKTALAAEEKAKIAEAALQFVGPADAVFLDGGSTVLELARLLRGRNRVTVVTNSLEVVKVLAEGGPTVLATGGEFRRLSRTFVGSLTKPFVETLHVDTAFMGTIGLARDGGLTTTDPREAYTKSLILQRARRVVLLADSSKIGKTSFVRFGSLNDVDVVVTDGGAPESDLRAFRKAGVKVVRG
jgi:DeoR/GlpR family transcriptional regulator of sugar metabolism